MAKKKKNKKKNDSILKEVDQSLDQTYQQLIDEIRSMQLRIEIADKKAKRKAKKKKNGKVYFNNELYSTNDYRRKVRSDIIKELQGDSLLDRVMATINDLTPIVVIIARLIASLILAILSVDSVKVHIKPEFLNKMTNVYNAAMSVS